MRIPTLRSDDCVSAESGGDSGDFECEGELEPEPALVLALRWKNEWIGGWYWRLRVCSAEVVGCDIVVPVPVCLCERER